MLIHSASQLLTLAGGPQYGGDLGRLEIIPNGALLTRDGSIAAVGTTDELRAAYPDEAQLNAAGRVVMPGFVDAHTHLVWAGDRAAEFEMRLQGKTYMEIMAAGGGIASTVRATRAASLADLLQQTQARALSMFQYGTTTAEAKTGYGLEINTELRQLEVLLRLDQEGPLQIVPTFLGAHAVPGEYRGDTPGYTELVAGQMIPELYAWWQENAGGRPLPFVDVFCETGVFDLEQTGRILQAASELGFPLKMHADEFDNLGGARLAGELKAVSADHLVKTSDADIRSLVRGGTAAVALPCTPFGLADAEYTPAREIIEAGGLLALATDLNPGTAWCESMQFVMALACRYLRLTPAEAIAAATINSAAAVGLADQVGSLEVGKQADVLVLAVDDYRQLGYRFGGNLVDTVVKRGRAYAAAHELSALTV
jgi:imidazolonepropionase